MTATALLSAAPSNLHLTGAAPGAEPVRADTLGGFSAGQSWRLELAQDRPHHVLFWLTRGQARASVDGVLRGCGAHNALFLPAGTLFSLHPGAQSFGFALEFAPGLGLGWPDRPLHLRIRDAAAQIELTKLIEAMLSERAAHRALCDEALKAHARLISVWLRRQEGAESGEPEDTPARLVARRFAAEVVARHAEHPALAEIAGRLGTTAADLETALRASAGEAPGPILDARLRHAAQSALARSGAQPEQVARALGFPSAAALDRFLAGRAAQTDG